MILLKVTKKQGFTLSLEDTFFKKLQGTPPPHPPPGRFRVKGPCFALLSFLTFA